MQDRFVLLLATFSKVDRLERVHLADTMKATIILRHAKLYVDLLAKLLSSQSCNCYCCTIKA